MDFLNRGFAQLYDLFRSMTVGTRITAALLLVVVVVSLAYLFNARVSGPDSYLLGGHPFSATEMPLVQGALAQAGLNDFEVEGNLIRIPRSKQAAYIAALADNNVLPAGFGDRLMKIVESQSPFTSRDQQRQMLKHARDSMLAKSIAEMRGIESAQVFTDSKETKGLHRQEMHTATVNVRMIGNQPLEARQAQAIRSMVAGAIAGLSREKVTVVDAGTGRAFTGETSDGAAGGLDDPYLSRKHEYEEKFQADIAALLSYVPGVAVSVNVELNKERSRKEESQKFDPKTIPIRTSSDETELASETSAPAGRPGFEAQQPNRGAQLSGAGRGATTKESRGRTDTTNVASTDITRADYVGLNPEKVTVSIVVPSTYLEEVWRRRNPQPAGQAPRQASTAELAAIEEQERTKIQRAVFNKIPHPADADPAELVTVTAFTAIPLAEEPKPGIPAQALGWLANSWSTLGMLGLAGVSLAMLRSVLRAPPLAPQRPNAQAAPIAQPALAIAETTEETEEAPPPKPRLRRRAAGGPNLRDDLVEMVREDPDAAANILKGWIGNVG
jgi:flagellar M-ring protein FliF